jgi:hypothetical protein
LQVKCGAEKKCGDDEEKKSNDPIYLNLHPRNREHQQQQQQ